jgi:hypothetical protein
VIKSRRIKWVGHVGSIVDRRGAYRTEVGRPDGKRSLVRPRLKWEGSTEIDLKEGGMET